ncbi:AraC family transcriptional regulator [Caulobacter sp. FWC2]|uniref:helix-turn-helix transcriptional regulator n=1 Tax=Caulobacter sp. FWC2 TaxID=69664 RepID=UPI000C153AC2|nr:AraC family transcriptional regulator [Caulobacter sp. FWC2]PIB92574.1 hypothetical protein CSW62_13940 [Caulobacter sp. FWC2]
MLAMEQLAEARIVVWQGGALWLLDTPPPHLRKTPSTDFHAHHAIQIVIGLGGCFQLWLSDTTLTGDVLVVAPDAPHRFEAEGAYAILFVEPESSAGRSIMREILGAAALKTMPDDYSAWLNSFLDDLKGWPCGEELVGLGKTMIKRLARNTHHDPVDDRIRQVIAWVAGHQEERIALTNAAAVARLSPSRLSHLFVEETGLSFKTYLLWVRLTRALQLMSEGSNLTEAAHGAGFSDSAHFSRTFRRMFGVAPANLKLV